MSDQLGITDKVPQARRPTDPVEINAVSNLRVFFENNKEGVFFSRQLEVRYEDRFFHWITNRAIRDLEEVGMVKSEFRSLSTGGKVKLLWHKSFRFYKRRAAEVVNLIEEYSNPNVGHAIGLHGEIMVLTGFASEQFVQRGRETRSHAGKEWTASEHDLDFIFERDGVAYGVEVKNTLGYMEKEEFDIKIKLCRSLGLRPVFVVRMMPATWIKELNQSGGFALLLKYQLYHWTHKDLAKRVADELGLPVDAPRTLFSTTMNRFLVWHNKQIV